MNYGVGVDIGGTFTDCVAVDVAGHTTLGKALSTPEDFSIGALDAVRNVAKTLGVSDEHHLLQMTSLFFHACTVGDNTLLSRSGPKTGLITTKGFADIILMMRGKLTDGLTEAEATHISALVKPDPLVPRELIAEVVERMDYGGRPIIPLNAESAGAVLGKLAGQKVESLAVSLLWSVSNDAHERLLAELIRSKYPDLFVCVSSEIAPYAGEYERTATTVINAYIGPALGAYLTRLRDALKGEGLQRDPLIMQAYGGVLSVGATVRNAVGTIESGPAAGVIGSQFLGELLQHQNILATDMGGTTFKVGVIRDGTPEKNYAPVISRYRTLSPKIWIESIGAGGGSIAAIDSETGIPKVGPRSAGAKPGPVCYGLGGTEPTVSDADLVLGYLNEHYFLGGQMELDRDGAMKAIEEKIAKPLGISVTEAASGIYRITNSHMADLLRRATIERGYDPRDFMLYVFGGAGPVHGCRYATELGVRHVVVPYAASVQGAMGLVCSNVVYEYGKSDLLPFPANRNRINQNFAELTSKAYQELAAAGFEQEQVVIRRSVDLRYRFQVHELTVSCPDGSHDLAEEDLRLLDLAFDDLYQRSYGNGAGFSEVGKEIVTFRLTATGSIGKPVIRREQMTTSDPRQAARGQRPVFFEEIGDFVPVETFDFQLMQPGMEVRGPAVIESPITTIVINPKDHAFMDEFRNMRVTIGE